MTAPSNNVGRELSASDWAGTLAAMIVASCVVYMLIHDSALKELAEYRKAYCVAPMASDLPRAQ